MPKAPGTAGSLVGVLIYLLMEESARRRVLSACYNFFPHRWHLGFVSRGTSLGR